MVKKENLAEIRCIALENGSWHKLEKPLDDKENENSCLVTYFEGGAYYNPENIKKRMAH